MTDQSLPAPGARPGITDTSEGMAYLDTLPRRLVSVYLPLFVIIVVLMFPFYWMVLTAIKPDEQLIDMDTYNPFFVVSPTMKHINKLLFETQYPLWLWNTMYVSVVATALALFASVLAAYALVRIRFRGAQWVGAAIFLAYLVPPSILFIPLATIIQAYGLFDTPLSLVLVYPTILIPFSTWLLMGYFKTIPYELEVAIVSEFVDGDIYRWGSLMAGALVGSLPLVILYSFFVEHYVSAMTGAVKE